MTSIARTVARGAPLALLLIVAAACGDSTPAEILQLTDLDPRQVELGDRIVIRGEEFPAAADIRRVTVTLRGTLARPGRPSCGAVTEVTITDPPVGATALDVASGHVRDLTYAESSNRIVRFDGSRQLEFVVTEELLQGLTRCPNVRADGTIDVPHATLLLGVGGSHGSMQGVTVRIDGLTGRRAIAGTLRGVVLDIHAPPARRLALELGANEAAQHTLDFMGITLASSQPDEGGLRVASVRPGSPSEQAGIVSNDVLTRVDGLSILTLADFRPPQGARWSAVTVTRGDVADERVVSLDGYGSRTPLDIVACAILLAVLAATLLVYLAPKPQLLAWIECRLDDHRRARMPRVGLFAWCMQRWREALRGRFDLGDDTVSLAFVPYLLPAALISAVACALAAEAFGKIPFDVAVTFTSAQLARSIGRFGSLAPTSRTFLGTVRALARTTFATMPAAVALTAIVLIVGSLEGPAIVSAQGGVPWAWHLFRTPATCVLGALYFVALLDGPDPTAPCTTVSIVTVACASLEWLGTLLAVAVGIAVFAGGWLLPGVSAAGIQGSVSLQMLGAVAFAAKVWSTMSVVAYVRWSWPRLRVSVLLARAWTSLLAIVAAAAAIEFAWILLVPRLPVLAVWAVSVASFSAVAAIVACGLVLRALARLERRAPDIAAVVSH